MQPAQRAAHHSAAESWRPWPLDWALGESSQARRHARALTGGRAWPRAPPTPHQQALTQFIGIHVSHVRVAPSPPPAGRRWGQMLEERAGGGSSLDRQADTPFSSALWAAPERLILQYQLEQHLLGETIPDILRWG